MSLIFLSLKNTESNLILEIAIDREGEENIALLFIFMTKFIIKDILISK